MTRLFSGLIGRDRTVPKPELSDVIYLRILHLAATTVEHDVEAALRSLLDSKKPIEVERVKQLVHVPAPTVPELAKPEVDLARYDSLLAEVGT